MPRWPGCADKRDPQRARSWKRRKQPRKELSWRTAGKQPEGRVSTARWNLKGLRRSTGPYLRGPPRDEPVGQRRGKVEPALWRRRRSHPPVGPRCVRTARYGRSGRDPRRARRVSGWHWENGPYKSRDEMGKEARRAIGQPNTTASATKAVRLRKQRPGGPGQSVGEGGWRESLKE